MANARLGFSLCQKTMKLLGFKLISGLSATAIEQTPKREKWAQIYITAWRLPSCVDCDKDKRQDKDKRSAKVKDRGKRQPEGSFFMAFYCNLRRLPQLTVGVGATPIPLHTQHNLSPVLVLILPTTNGWKAEWTLERTAMVISRRSPIQ